MAKAGELTYETKLDKGGFEKGLNSLKSVAGTALKARNSSCSEQWQQLLED